MTLTHVLGVNPSSFSKSLKLVIAFSRSASNTSTLVLKAGAGSGNAGKQSSREALWCEPEPEVSNGILLQPNPRNNGNYPPEGCIVLPEGHRRPKVEAARRQDNAAQRRIISGWPEGKVVIITFLNSQANNIVPDPGTISLKPGIMGPQTPGQ